MLIKTILFDVGGVLIRPLDQAAAERRYQKFAMLLGYEDGGAMFHRFFGGPEWMATRVGEMTWAEMWPMILAEHGLKEPEAQEQFVVELFAWEGASAEMRTLVEGLHDRYQLAILSNASDILEGRLKRLDIARYFDPIINSHRIGAAKPDERAFAITLERLNVQPKEVFFIDDREGNTAVAEAMGIHRHIFADVAALKHDLRRLGIL